MERLDRLVLCALTLLVAGGCEAFQREPRPRFAEDLGPDRLEVEALARYPDEIQRDYTVFAMRCSKCHTPARPLNSANASPQIWAKYVTEMWRKTGSGISHRDMQQILAFLAYDSKVRKLDHRAEFEAHRRRLLEAFKQQEPAAYEELYAGREDEAVRVR